MSLGEMIHFVCMTNQGDPAVHCLTCRVRNAFNSNPDEVAHLLLDQLIFPRMTTAFACCLQKVVVDQYDCFSVASFIHHLISLIQLFKKSQWTDFGNGVMMPSMKRKSLDVWL